MVSTHRPDERLLETAYELFSVRGVRDVGVDELVERAGVAKATLYRHFASKDELILAFLQLREERWTLGWLEAKVQERGGTAEERILSIFDLFDEWFREPQYAGCPFIKVLLEMGPGHPAGAACVEHLGTLCDYLTQLATEAGFRDPADLAKSLLILVYGSVIQAAAGDAGAAGRARPMALAVMRAYRQAPAQS
ncbi:MAG TPA: helix-turn-helix domain-containing protein [Acidimicrobiales bacterium]|jgi:AcrR family transcriptional regulator|nr:helix-turn-helix domain-containing protein [Acidimicrobiales bacterium]